MRLSEAGREHIIELNAQLSAESRAGNFPYDSTQLGGGGFTEVIMPGTKPTLSAAGYAGYWPGGFPDGDPFAMVVADTPLEYMQSDMANILRRQIKELTISRHALARYEQLDSQRLQTKYMRAELGDALVPRIMLACERAGKPLVFLNIGTWDVRTSHGQLFGAIMQYPAGIRPRTALQILKDNA